MAKGEKKKKAAAPKNPPGEKPPNSATPPAPFSKETPQRNEQGHFQPKPTQQDPAKLVYSLAAQGLPQRAIAAILEISVDTLQRRFLAEYHKGKGTAALTVGRLFFQRLPKSDYLLSLAAQHYLGLSTRQTTQTEDLTNRSEEGLTDAELEQSIRELEHKLRALGAALPDAGTTQEEEAAQVHTPSKKPPDTLH